MAHWLKNPHRGTPIPGLEPLPSTDAQAVADSLAACPAHAPTPLTEAPGIAAAAGVASVHVKDERGRMGLGSFKALGAAYVIAHAAQEAAPAGPDGTTLAGHTYVTASAGNHGMSVAAGAGIFGARAVIYLSETVPESFAARLRDKGAEVVREGATYEDSMAAAERAAEDKGWTLLSDSSWPGYTDLPHRLMEGYLQLAAEAAEQIGTPPTHVLLQAGVGGLAAAVAAHARQVWGDAPTILVVEPEAAPALMESLRAGRVCDTAGPVSTMGRLDCKTPSMIALAGLSRDADLAVTVTDDAVAAALPALARDGFETTPSGGAGLAALLDGLPGLDADSRVLAFVTEMPDG
ncbi:pyridoxal-phosphate dependent enzyme [Pseudoponticoccus marisrubri]|uniref:PLP-dependent lyase/thiolase n=1 Tax=Pseudoponticoccus marisrubri TaxID=1685382 RepID=A0A0W7WIP0_9RHOB|nr:pyridoxal-phosphate dependent enzyme [Pseudoponticoccus marisrubri]KUF10445.1 PLP-dependent lyase/thiolase [Pseudoponticoccus marisrubri]